MDFIKESLSVDKPKMSLVEPKFVLGIAEVLSIGAKKYSKGNWKKCEDASLYEDALLRHIYAYLGGEELDKVTGKSHLHHAACNLMFLEWMNNEKQ